MCCFGESTQAESHSKKQLRQQAHADLNGQLQSTLLTESVFHLIHLQRPILPPSCVATAANTPTSSAGGAGSDGGAGPRMQVGQEAGISAMMPSAHVTKHFIVSTLPVTCTTHSGADG
jgi:hypothetical protein